MMCSPVLPNNARQQCAAITAREEIRLLVEALSTDAQLHLVGGVVRDLISGVALPADIDLATVLPPHEVDARLQAKGIKVIPLGIQHGTVAAHIHGTNVEITTFRIPGSRTSTGYSHSIEEDLGGRDFTCNAMAIRLMDLTFVDPFDGIKDLTAGILRGVPPAETRFTEDPLRILRMVRFGPAQGRKVDPDTISAAKKVIHQLSSISPERLRVELEKILLSSYPAEAFRFMASEGILPHLLPEAIPSVGFEQNEFHEFDVFEHTLQVIEACPSDLLLRLAALFHDLGKPHTLSIDEQGRRHFYEHERVSETLCEEAMERLRFSHDATSRVKRLVRHHMRPLKCGPAAVRRLMRDLQEDLPLWRTFKGADHGSKSYEPVYLEEAKGFDALLSEELLRREREHFERLTITGDDIMALGIQQGKLVGEVLTVLRERVLDDPSLNTPEVLTRIAQELIESKK